MGIEIYYILLIIILKPAAWRKCNATAAGRGNDDEDEVDCVEVMDVDVVIIMVRWKKERLEEQCSSNWIKMWEKKQRITRRSDVEINNIISIVR